MGLILVGVLSFGGGFAVHKYWVGNAPQAPADPMAEASEVEEAPTEPAPPEPVEVPARPEEPVRVGQPGVEPPIFLRKVPPAYPEQARALGLQGYVILEVTFDREGAVVATKVLRGLGNGALGFEEAAAEAVQAWEVEPARVNGLPVSSTMTLKVDFIRQ